MNNDKPRKAVSGPFGLVGEDANKSETKIIKNILIPLTYIRINTLFEKILKKHC